jgi:glycosyltransferase involved in cell wall biosynthesis
MRILLVTNDRVGRERAGPAIRCVELARVLSRHHQVTVASSLPGEMELPGVQFLFNALANPRPLRAAARQTDVAITQGLVLDTFPFLRRSCRYIAVDLYDPYLFEYLAQKDKRLVGWRYLRQWQLLNDQLCRGDFFICANERQWDYWIGRLCALGRLTTKEHERDPSFRSLLAVVPFGIDAESPRHKRAVVKGIMPGISKDDILLLWAGGIWQWFDPLTVIRGMSLIKERSDIKLLFLGTRHPNPDIPEMPIVNESRRLAQQLGVLGRTVFFREGWVPFEERQNFLLEADMGVSAHVATIEARLSFRTRILDYLWAGLPMILTEGDYFAELVARESIGKTVSPGNAEGWKEAILSLVEDPNFRQPMQLRLQALREQFLWEKVTEPLVRYCREPYSTRGHSRFQIGFSRLLTLAYRLRSHLRLRNSQVTLSRRSDSVEAKIVENRYGARGKLSWPAVAPHNQGKKN